MNTQTELAIMTIAIDLIFILGIIIYMRSRSRKW